jgi:glycerophosphoryl diester phosphodiesterase
MPEQHPRPILVTAHRGASAAAPENTVAAFQLALSAGVDAIETDIRLSRDGVPVLAHDEDLIRVAGSPAKIKDLTAQELSKIDVGSWMGAEFRGQGIPPLTWLADQCRQHTRLVLDLKVSDCAAAIAKALEATDFPFEQAFICSWSNEQAADIRKHLPTAQLVFIEDPLVHSDAEWLRSLALRGYNGLSLHHQSIDPELVANAHASGLDVFAWTVNTDSDARRVQQAGVDGIITDGTADGDFTTVCNADQRPLS